MTWRFLLALLGLHWAGLAAAQPVDKIFLKDGQVLSGRLVSPSFRFATIYGEVEVPNSACLQLSREGERIDRLKTVNDEVITGYLVEPPKLQISGGPTVSVRPELVIRVTFSPRGKVNDSEADYFMMKNGDSFKGKVQEKSFTFTTSYGTLDTAFSSLMKLEDVNGQTRMYLADGNEVLGYISSDAFTVRTVHGFTLRIPKSSIKLVQMR